MFLWPTTTKRITSNFGYRTHPITKKQTLHAGVDIAEPGTHPIYAAADGTVSRSYTSSSYGECIFILHKIGGNTFETVYAHMRSLSRKVKEGQAVKRGQEIGIMGNTGNSTGQHLHFEVHEGRWTAGKENAVDPLKFFSAPNTYSKTEKILRLPKTAISWRIYPINKSPVKGNEVGFLKPSKFGGLEYKIIGNPMPDVYTIQTKDFGKVNIYAGKDTSATIVTKKQDFKAGDKVKIKSSAKYYSRTKNVAIPAKHKNKTLTVQQVGKTDLLIKELFSWVKISDVQ